MQAPTPVTLDGRRVRGARTRQAILTHAAQVASSEGLEAVSLQRLAGELGISKSGLFAHFGSKQELQLATVEEAGRVFTEEVLLPGLRAPAGSRRLWAMCNSYLSYLERGVFPGGCFFEAAAAEFDSRPGPVRDLVLERHRFFSSSLDRAAREGQAAGDIRADADTGQLAWELNCLLTGANASYLVERDDQFLERARRAIRARLEGVITRGAARLSAR